MCAMVVLSTMPEQEWIAHMMLLGAVELATPRAVDGLSLLCDAGYVEASVIRRGAGGGSGRPQRRYRLTPSGRQVQRVIRALVEAA